MGLGARQYREMRRRPELKQDRRPWVGRGYLMMMWMRMGRERKSWRMTKMISGL